MKTCCLDLTEKLFVEYRQLIWLTWQFGGVITYKASQVCHKKIHSYFRKNQQKNCFLQKYL